MTIRVVMVMLLMSWCGDTDDDTGFMWHGSDHDVNALPGT